MATARAHFSFGLTCTERLLSLAEYRFVNKLAHSDPMKATCGTARLGITLRAHTLMRYTNRIQAHPPTVEGTTRNGQTRT